MEDPSRHVPDAHADEDGGRKSEPGATGATEPEACVAPGVPRVGVEDGTVGAGRADSGIDVGVPAPHRRRALWRTLLKRATLAALGVLLAGVTYELLTWPEVDGLRSVNPETTAFIERYKKTQASQGREPGLAWRWAPYDRVSPHLKRAVLVAEDIDFFAHAGFEKAELTLALRQAYERRRMPRGASTITQQLAKNLWLSPSRNPLRKLKEALLTVQLERTLDKRRILELYLNVVEFGPGIYGAEAAARFYFGTSAADLSEQEAAALAASLSRPSTWNPTSTSSSYRRHTRRILRRMEKANFLWKLV